MDEYPEFSGLEATWVRKTLVAALFTPLILVMAFGVCEFWKAAISSASIAQVSFSLYRSI